MTRQGTGPAAIDRRSLLGGLGAGAVAGALGSAPARATGTDLGSAGDPAGRRPNILLILADDIGYTDLGCFGSEIETPNLDTLAKRGRRYTHLYNNARCTPTRASVLTGLYPTQAGLGLLIADQGHPGYQGYLNDSCVTFAEVLSDAGYRTSIAGKWHVAPWDREDALPHRRGFDQSYCTVGGGYYRPGQYLNGQMIGRPTAADYHATEAITDYAEDFLRRDVSTGQPFVCYLSYTAPHYPLHAWEADIEPYRGRYDAGYDAVRAERLRRAQEAGVVDAAVDPGDLDPTPTAWPDVEDPDWEAARMEVYAGQVTAMDRGIGRILATLDELGVADNTLVLFLGDNGGSAEFLRPGAHDTHPTIDGSPMVSGNIPGVYPGPSTTYASYGINWATVSNTPLQKWKRWVHEGGISTPCIASWPGQVDDGGISHQVMQVMDLLPTFAELAGAEIPARRGDHPLTPVEGESFAASLTPTDDDWQRTDAIFFEHVGNRAVRSGRWKLTSAYDDATEQYGPWQLFDIADDRLERHDLAARHRPRVQGLATAWEQWATRTGVRPWNSQTQYR